MSQWKPISVAVFMDECSITDLNDVIVDLCNASIAYQRPFRTDISNGLLPVAVVGYKATLGIIVKVFWRYSLFSS